MVAEESAVILIDAIVNYRTQSLCKDAFIKSLIWAKTAEEMGVSRRRSSSSASAYSNISCAQPSESTAAAAGLSAYVAAAGESPETTALKIPFFRSTGTIVTRGR